MWNMSFVFAHHSKLSSPELIFPIGPEGGASESASALLQGGSERPLTGCVGSRCGRSGGLSYKTRDPTNRRARLSQARVVFPCLTAASSPRYSSERNRESPHSFHREESSVYGCDWRSSKDVPDRRSAPHYGECLQGEPVRVVRDTCCTWADNYNRGSPVLVGFL